MRHVQPGLPLMVFGDSTPWMARWQVDLLPLVAEIALGAYMLRHCDDAAASRFYQLVARDAIGMELPLENGSLRTCCFIL